MNYRARGKERKVKLLIIKLFQLFQFRSVYLPFSAKVVLLGNILLSYSLFQNWVLDKVQGHTWNSFSSISGNIGYPFLLGTLCIYFFLLSNNKKNNLKLHSNISFLNHSSIGIIGIFVTSLSIISLSFIHGYQTLSQDIISGKGGLLSLTSGLVIILGSYLMRSDYKKHNIEIFISESGELKEKFSNKNNTTLPF
ncbi:MAG: hypothetical protein GY828_04965 [Candidatus Gracilibacteria bacterium]|nr:hypothetical protein [Candidatus Gracilibacteria bacterium]